MATHSSILAWRIPGTGEPDGLPSMGSHRVRHDWSNLAAAAAAVYIRQCYPLNLSHPVLPTPLHLVWEQEWGENSKAICEKSPSWFSLILYQCNSLESVKVAQSCSTLCDPMAYTVHGILQAKILERVAFPFSRRSSQSRDRTQVSPIAGGFLTSWATREAQLPTPNLTAICLQKLIPLLFQAFDLLFIITTPFLLALIFCWLISCLITLGH